MMSNLPLINTIIIALIVVSCTDTAPLELDRINLMSKGDNEFVDVFQRNNKFVFISDINCGACSLSILECEDIGNVNVVYIGTNINYLSRLRYVFDLDIYHAKPKDNTDNIDIPATIFRANYTNSVGVYPVLVEFESIIPREIKRYKIIDRDEALNSCAILKEFFQ